MTSTTPDAYSEYIARRRLTDESEAPTREIRPEPQHGLHVKARQPRPRVYTTTGGGYRIEPWYYANGTGTDQLDTVVQAEKPGWLQFLMIPLAFLPPVWLLVSFLTDRKYKRQFWLKNGFDPDSFS